MQSNKASKKTRKNTEATAVPELNAAEAVTKPRASRSSKSKVQESNETAPSSHHHKIVASEPESVVEPVNAQAEVRESDNKVMAAAAGAGSSPAANILDPVGAVIAENTNRAAENARREPEPVREVRQEDVAKLAYSYFLARGCEHGHAEEDWFRAERELKSRLS